MNNKHYDASQLRRPYSTIVYCSLLTGIGISSGVLYKLYSARPEAPDIIMWGLVVVFLTLTVVTIYIIYVCLTGVLIIFNKATVQDLYTVIRLKTPKNWLIEDSVGITSKNLTDTFLTTTIMVIIFSFISAVIIKVGS